MARHRGNSVWERYERNAHRTFEEAASKYLREFDGKDKERQRYCIEALIPYIGHLPCGDVDEGALETYKEDRRLGIGAFKKPVMAGTVNKELTVVTTILNRACRDWRWIPNVPRIRHVKGAKRIAYPLTWDEQKRLFTKLPDHWALGCAVFAVNTGVRKAELFGLKWSDMVPVPELDTFVFILNDTKNGHSRAVICNSYAQRAVNYQRDNGSAYVFPSKRAQNVGSQVRACNGVWRKAWEQAGMPSDPLIRKGIHNLRHTYAHRLRAADVPSEDRDALMGHHNASLSQHYALPDIERLQKMSERVTERRDTVVLRASSVTA